METHLDDQKDPQDVDKKEDLADTEEHWGDSHRQDRGQDRRHRTP